MRRIHVSLSLTTSTFAKDAISASVTNVNLMTLVVAVNGNRAAGNFAVGTIQPFYTVNQYQFTAGQINICFTARCTGQHDGPDAELPGHAQPTQVGLSQRGIIPLPQQFFSSGPGWSTRPCIAVSIGVIASNRVKR
jgi:hypothetical protein